jgi:penicillin-binding protein 2
MKFILNYKKNHSKSCALSTSISWIVVSAFKVCLIFGLSAICLIAQTDKNRTDKKGNQKTTNTQQTKLPASILSPKVKPVLNKVVIAKASERMVVKVFNKTDELFRQETISNIAQDEFENEDLEVRRIAVEALGTHAGTIVVLEPTTGKILSIVNQTWAFRRSFKPCSTIKLVTGIAGLKSNIIDSEGKIRNSFFPLDLTNSIAYSNNSYFQAVGASLGHAKMVAIARELGFGEMTGINAEGEVSGKVSDFKFGSDIYRQYSHGDDFEVTALQLAVLVSTITNGGKAIIPTIQKQSPESSYSIITYRRGMNLKPDIFQRILPGMMGSVNFGTAQNAYESTANIVGKTGSCIEDGNWLGLFASASSAVNPKFAVVVITKGSEERGKVAAEIAGKIYSNLGNRFSGNELVGNNFRPTYRITVQNSIDSDKAKSEDSDDLGYFSGVASSRKIRTRTGVRDIASKKTIETVNEVALIPDFIYNPPTQINRNIIRPRLVVLKKNKIN